MEFVHVETDSLLVIQGISSSSSVSSFDLLLMDVKDLLSSFIHNCISFAKRSANRTSHILARTPNSMSEHSEWFHCIFAFKKKKKNN